MLLEDVLKEFIFDCTLRKMTDRTIEEYNGNNVRLQQYIKTQFQITELEQVNHSVVKAYIQYLIDLGRRETYINSIIKSLRAFFKYCVREEYIAKSPMEKVSFQREPTVLINTFTDMEAYKMVESCKTNTFMEMRNKLILIVLLDSGIRCHELINIKLSDISTNCIKIFGKGKKEWFVPLTPTIHKYLLKYMRIRETYLLDKYQLDKEYLFLSFACKKLTLETVERVVKLAAQKADVRPEIRSSPHTCRHYYAQAQLRNGCDVYTLSRLLGHENISITKRYLQSITDSQILELAIKTTPLSNIK